MGLTEQQLVDELESIAVATTDAMLAEGGFVPPPTMHMFCDDLGRQPYAGYVRTRPFYPGDDAHTDDPTPTTRSAETRHRLW